MGENRITETINMQPTILVLKEGTENAQGTQQCVSNINACAAIVDAIRTTLGPRGMDKLIVDNRGKATISNDGATIMKLLDVVHPAAKTLGNCELFEEKQVGGERFNFFTGVPKSKTCTIILRGGAEQFMEETERSLHDAIMIV